MERTLIRDLSANKVAIVCGFIEKIRDQKTMQFIVLRDRSGKAQITVSKTESPKIAEVFSTLNIDSVISMTGKVVSAPQVKLGGIEILPTNIEVLSQAKLSPIDKETGPDLAMDYRWIDLRDDKKIAWFKVQTVVEQLMREFLIKNEFIEAHTPKICGASTEGGAEVFEVKYYDRKAYLTQSPQLYKQMAMSAGFERFFEVTSCYRAEKSYTSRHATEFFSLDIEMSYIKNHHDVMDVQQAMLLYVMAELQSKHSKLMKEATGKDFVAQTVKFPRVTLLESYELLKKEKGYEVPRESKGDLDPEGERLLCEIAREKFGSDFIHITDYPFAARAFYSMKHATTKSGEPVLCKSFDLLYRGVEISSGAQRENDPARLEQNIRDKGLNPEGLRTYINFFEYGCPPHGGFSIGLARFFSKLLEVPHVRDMSFVYRSPDRLTP